MKATGEKQGVMGIGSGENHAHPNEIAMGTGFEWPPGLLDTIIDLFLDDAPKQIAELQAALQHGDCKRVRAVSHKLRGSSDVLGTASISALASVVEEAAKRSDLELVVETAPKLFEELQELLTELTDADIKELP